MGMRQWWPALVLCAGWAITSAAAISPVATGVSANAHYDIEVREEWITLADGVRLARRRGELMQASGGGRAGAMAAILGLPESAEASVVDAGRAHGVLVLADCKPSVDIVMKDVAIGPGTHEPKPLHWHP